MLNQYRAKVVNSLRTIGIILGGLILVSYLIANRSSQPIFGQWPLILLFALAIFFLFWRRIPLRIRSMGLVLIMYLLAIDNLNRGFLLGGGRLWLIAFCALTGALLGTRFAAIAIALSTATFLIFFWLFNAGILNGAYDLSITDPDWIAALLALVIIALIVSLPAAFLLEYLVRALEIETDQRNALERLNRETTDLNQSLQTLNDTVANSLKPALRRMQLIAEKLDADSRSADIIEADLLMRVRKDIVRLHAQVADAQLLSRTTSTALFRQTVNLREAVDRALASLENEIGEKLRVEMDEQLTVDADRGLLVMLFHYLFRYLGGILAEESSASLSLVNARYQERDSLHIRARSAGSNFQIGEERFVPFYTPFLALETNLAGTELMLIQRIVSLHGGRIHATSSRNDEIDIYLAL